VQKDVIDIAGQIE